MKQTLLDFTDFNTGNPIGLNPTLVQSVVEAVTPSEHSPAGGCIITMKGDKQIFFVRGDYTRVHQRINDAT